MKKISIILICLIISFVILTGCSSNSSQTHKINEVLDSYERAYLQKDIGILSDILADEITVITNNNDSTERTTYTKQEYLSMTSFSFVFIEEIYELELNDRNIIKSGNTATVTTTIYSKTKIFGETQTQNTQNGFKLKQFNNQWLIIETTELNISNNQ